MRSLFTQAPIPSQANVAVGLTFVSRVHPLSQQEAAELFFRQFSILNFHQVRGHTERIVLKVPFTLLPATARQTIERLDHNVIMKRFFITIDSFFVMDIK